MAEYEWDPHKNEINVRKHGIDFQTALDLWSGVYIELETKPGNDPCRWLVIGEIAGWCWTAVITRRGPVIRIISVRRSRDYEREALDEHKRGQKRARGNGRRD